MFDNIVNTPMVLMLNFNIFLSVKDSNAAGVYLESAKRL